MTNGRKWDDEARVKVVKEVGLAIDDIPAVLGPENVKASH